MTSTATATGPERRAIADREANDRALDRYYRLHAKVYDLTRWSFLFGRRGVPGLLGNGPAPRSIVEIGCGTGRVLAGLAGAFPQARLLGLDLSEDMLGVATGSLERFGDRVSLRRAAYGGDAAPVETDAGPPDLMVFSYALSMFNPGWEDAIDRAASDLAPHGRIAVVDFHDTPWRWFARWMGVNHVRMEGHLLPRLRSRFANERCEVRRAYGGVWRWLGFVGRVGGVSEGPSSPPGG